MLRKAELVEREGAKGYGSGSNNWCAWEVVVVGWARDNRGLLACWSVVGICGMRVGWESWSELLGRMTKGSVG